MEDVAGQALRVNADQRRGGFHVAGYEGDGFFDCVCRRAIGVGGEVLAKAVNAELAPAGREISGGNLFDFVFAHFFIIAAESGGFPQG